MSVESAAVSHVRRIWVGLVKGGVTKVNGTLSVDVANYLQNRKRKELTDLEDRYGVDIVIQGDPSMPPGEGELEFVKGGASSGK